MQPFQFPVIDWLMLAPVMTVIITGLVALMIEVLQPKRNNDLMIGVSLAGLAVAGWFLFIQFPMADGMTFNNMVSRDITALVLQAVLIATCFIVFLFSEGYLRERKIAWGEFYPLALWSTAGGMLMVGTHNLLMIFLGLEVLSISLYILAGMAREETKSEESAIKYLLMGAFASAFLLMGIAFFFGSTGSVDLAAAAVMPQDGAPFLTRLYLAGILLMLIGVGFKLALVPFHQWTADVYQGAPTNVTAFMAAASKTAAVGLMIRLLTAALPVYEFWVPIIAVLAALTMIVGNAAALVQVDIKRILGYSSIANAGYVMVAILAHAKSPQTVSLAPVLFFMAGYAITTLGSFAVLTLAAKDGKEATRLSDLYGFWQRSPFAAAMLIVFLASQIGIPPTVGFFGKFLIFQGAAQAGYLWLALTLAITSVLGASYYLAILRACFVADETAVPNASGTRSMGLTAALVTCGLGVFLALGILPGLSDRSPLRDPSTLPEVTLTGSLRQGERSLPPEMAGVSSSGQASPTPSRPERGSGEPASAPAVDAPAETMAAPAPAEAASASTAAPAAVAPSPIDPSAARRAERTNLRTEPSTADASGQP